MADYPTVSFNPATRSAGQTIAAAHINDVQAEIRAIELALLSSGLAHHLLFVDATYDIGASGATRPRDLFLSRNATIGGSAIVGDNAADAFSVGVSPPTVDTLFQSFVGGNVTLMAQNAAGGAAYIGNNFSYSAGAFRRRFTSEASAMAFSLSGAGTTEFLAAASGAAGDSFTWTVRGILSNAGLLRLHAYSASTPTFVAGDKYLVVDANGNIHVSALGPAS